jgi:peptidoglycan lytic transglycosylase
MRRLLDTPAAAVAREHRIRRERPRFDLFEVFSVAQHWNEPGVRSESITALRGVRTAHSKLNSQPSRAAAKPVDGCFIATPSHRIIGLRRMVVEEPGRSNFGVRADVFAVTDAARFTIAIFIAVVVCSAFAGCAARAPASSPQPQIPIQPAPPLVPSVEGVASWYGPGFHGHRTSSGAVYDQEDLTAASTLFPLGTHLLVTNLANNRSVEVTINDHGPYVKGRQIDLSRKAARVLGVIGPGTARVRMDVLATPAGGPAIGERYFVQVGSFADSGNARRVQQRLAARYSDVHIETAEAGTNLYYRVRMGAFMNHDEAASRATQVAMAGYAAVIITE